MQDNSHNVEYSGFEIAIIGMSCRLPGARNILEYWNNIKNGKETISHFSIDELKKEGINEEILKNPNYIKAKGIIDDLEYFDPQFFRITPQEAHIMDPQMRLLLKCTWEALEDAGYAADTGTKQIGVYTAASDNFDWRSRVYLSKIEMPGIMSGLLTGKDLISTQLSHKLNLQGPSLSLFSACSSSLSAVHLACQSIISGDCDMAIAGASAVSLPKKSGYVYVEEMISSVDGHCRPFDANATGTVFSDGAAIVILKSMEEARRDGDNIYAIIKGSAINNDGERKIGFTAPSLNGQAEVIKSAHKLSGVDPKTISYIEAHGTGTLVGDPIEFEALKLAFDGTQNNSCLIGSVKANIGHTDTVSGLAGLIKTSLALKNKLIPPSINYNKLNPKINIKDSPFGINVELKRWINEKNPLRAGVSSFGIGGTNVHVVLEEAPQTISSPTNRESELLLLSANNKAALDRLSLNLVNYLKENKEIKIEDVSYSLITGRKDFAFRRNIQCSSSLDAIEKLSTLGNRIVSDNKVLKEKKVVFVLPGLDSLYINFGKGLYQKEPLFKDELDNCFRIIKSISGEDVKQIIYPANNNPEEQDLIHRIDISQFILFSFEYALVKLVMCYGIEPHSMIGYSFGEYVMACLSGVFSLEDTIQIINKRGDLLKNLPEGKMLSVPLTGDKLESKLNDNISLAIDNGESCVVSGSKASVEEFENKMKTDRIICFPLHNMNCAIHSHMLDPVLREFEEFIDKINLNSPKIPYISCVTGDWIKISEATNTKYWINQLRNTVQASLSIEKLKELNDVVFLEIGPGGEFSSLINRKVKSSSSSEAINLIRTVNNKTSDNNFFINRIGQLWMQGVKIEWTSYFKDEIRNKISLPTYPFEEQKYWIDKINYKEISKIGFNETDKISKTGIDKWLYVPSWHTEPLLDKFNGKIEKKETWLLFINDLYFTRKIQEKLITLSDRTIIVKFGDLYSRISKNEYIIRPSNKDDYSKLFQDTEVSNLLIDKIIHAWGLTDDSLVESSNEILDKTYYSLLYISQIIKTKKVKSLDLCVLTNNAFDVLGVEYQNPLKATIQAPLIVISQEKSLIRVKHIDIDLSQNMNHFEHSLIEKLTNELYFENDYSLISYRGNQRFCRKYNQIFLNKNEQDKSNLRLNGVYLITGGFGRIGLEIAKLLGKTYKAKIALIGRSDFPERENWEDWIVKHGENDKISFKIKTIREIESEGGEICLFKANVANKEELNNAIIKIEKKHGILNGVFHSAGVNDNNVFSLLESVEKQFCENQFDAKIYGLQVLEDVLKGKELDFCMLMSSIASVLGGIGFYGYAAGNSYMDAYVNKCNKNSSFPWISINWDTWVNDKAKENKTSLIGKEMKELSLTNEEGLEVVQMTLSNLNLPNIVVSTGDLNSRFNKWIKLEQKANEATNISNELFPRPELSSDYLAPNSIMEEKIINIWQEVLGFDKIGIDDNYFDLGGDSLDLIQIKSRIHKIFEIEIPIIELFQLETIKDIADYLSENEIKSSNVIRLQEKKHFYQTSSAQKRIYFIQILDPKTIAYNLPNIISLSEFDKDEIKSAFIKLIERHESLRTSFHLINDQLIQKIHNNVEFDVNEYHVDSDEKLESAQKLALPFDLSKAPLLRVNLWKSNNKTILMIDMHHIITDDVSFTILKEEFSKLHKGKVLNPNAFQYKDYSYWQCSVLQQLKQKEQEKYWLNTFKDELPVLNLPADFKRPIKQNFDGAKVEHFLNEEETEIIKSYICNEYTAFMVMLGIYNVFLSKITSQKDIIIGILTSGRQCVEFEGIIGMFVNTLALRNYIDSNSSFNDILNSTKQISLEAFENQEYQFEDLVKKVMNQRDKSRNPLFDVVFNMLSESEPDDDSGIEERYIHQNHTSQFDLSLKVNSIGEKYKLTWEYSTVLFKAETIERFINCFKRIINQLNVNKNIKIYEIEIITQDEKKMILSDFNDTNVDYPEDKTIYELFEEQAEKAPGKTALIFENQEISYFELNKKSNQLARYLRGKGIKPNDKVGLLLDRSIEMVVCIFGILKVGGVYVPIDPFYPESRINFIIKNSASKLILAEKIYIDKIDKRFQVDIFNEIDLQNEKGGDLKMHIKLIDPAYVIYTSGSAGAPKGVQVSHLSVVNLIYFLQERYPLFEGDSYLLKTSYCFDVSVSEVFGWILGGGKLVILGRDQEKDPVKIIESIYNIGVTHINFVPSVFKSFSQSVKFRERIKLNSLKHIMLAGEELLREHLQEFKELELDIQIDNLYGPTESTVYASYYRVLLNSNESIPIGIPTKNTQVYILDENNKVQPVGVSGELCISGKGLAQGYLNNPELTMEKFVDHPFKEGECLYKTGDLARWLPDGIIEFKGRCDQQIKIRGYRIEIGEIENCLLKHESVKECTIVVRNRFDDKDLCAYVVLTEQENSLNETCLKDYLKDYLPYYMIPSFFIKIKEIPLTQNGKIDSKSLPEPEIEKMENCESSLSNTEEKLIEIWAEVLQLDKGKIGLNSNFFDLGGHSISIIKLARMINHEFKCNITIAQLFNLPKIQNIADYILKGSQAYIDIVKNIDEAINDANENLDLINKLNLE